eukprot:scaffold65716_cov98-Phaeocystis_antarctica.AAC.1
MSGSAARARSSPADQPRARASDSKTVFIARISDTFPGMVRYFILYGHVVLAHHVAHTRHPPLRTAPWNRLYHKGKPIGHALTSLTIRAVRPASVARARRLASSSRDSAAASCSVHRGPPLFPPPTQWREAAIASLHTASRVPVYRARSLSSVSHAR